jgi:hypothetical protein
MKIILRVESIIQSFLYMGVRELVCWLHLCIKLSLFVL